MLNQQYSRNAVKYVAVRFYGVISGTKFITYIRTSLSDVVAFHLSFGEAFETRDVHIRNTRSAYSKHAKCIIRNACFTYS
jgi:hypothetical protein